MHWSSLHCLFGIHNIIMLQFFYYNFCWYATFSVYQKVSPTCLNIFKAATCSANLWKWVEMDRRCILSSTKNTCRHSGTSLYVINGHYSKFVILENNFVVDVFPLNLTSMRLVAHIAPRSKLKAGRVWWWPLQLWLKWTCPYNLKSSNCEHMASGTLSTLPCSSSKILAGSSSLFNTLSLLYVL